MSASQGAAGSRARTRSTSSCARVERPARPPQWFEGVELAPPLADFEGAAQWVEHPCRDGIVLVGDAAATLDPSFGAGLSKTLLDVECLLEALGSTTDRDAALAAYAASHDRTTASSTTSRRG